MAFGQHQQLDNVLAVRRTLLICILMVMPPNMRAGLGIGGTLLALFALHKFIGPREVRKPFWALADKNSVNLTEEGQGEIP